MRDSEKPPSLDDLGRRLKAVRQREAEKSVPRQQLGFEQAGRYGAAWRLAVEMVAGLVVGGGMGWLIDQAVGTRPLFFVVFFFLGAGAGIRGAWRAAQEINREQEAANRETPDKRGETD